jgi:DNA-binding NarL/FixJ family response regulator
MSSTLRTFIVEDNPIIYENLVTTLEELTNVEVVGNATGETDAVRWLSEEGNAVDLLIVDVFLLNGSGLGVLKAVKDAALPVRRVVLTNYASADIRRRCTVLGADRVFDKSCELDELISYCMRVADGAATAPGALE